MVAVHSCSSVYLCAACVEEKQAFRHLTLVQSAAHLNTPAEIFHVLTTLRHVAQETRVRETDQLRIPAGLQEMLGRNQTSGLRPLIR